MTARILFIVTGLALLFMLVEKLNLGLVRFFDVDEFAYLHWAHNVFSGKIPYKDFFLYVPPGFLYLTAPLFFLTTDASILTMSRIFSFIVFTGIVVITIWLFWEVRKSWIAVFSGIILIFLPMPSDKFLEFRPDNLAVLCVLLGLVFQIKALQGAAKYQSNALILAGMMYGFSLLILPKTFPQIIVAFLIALGARLSRFLLYGLCIPFVVFFVWVIASGNDATTVWYSLIRLPFEVNKVGNVFVMQPDLFFYPNAIYYGEGGMSVGLLANHFIWLMGIIIGVIRLFSPFAFGKERVWVEVLLAGSFVVHILMYILVYPMRHVQYLIPVSVFVALYCADGLNAIWKSLSRRAGIKHIAATLIFVGLVAVVHTHSFLINVKSRHTNAIDRHVLEQTLSSIPKHAYIFDLVGATIFYRDPYYVSALPFGEWEAYMSKPLPSLIHSLSGSNTQYIYEGRLGRVSSLTEDDKLYIRTHYQQGEGDMSHILVKKHK